MESIHATVAGGALVGPVSEQDLELNVGGRTAELAHIVYFSDLLISRFGSGLEIERLDTHVFDKRLQQIGLSSNNFVEIVDLNPDMLLEPLAD